MEPPEDNKALVRRFWESYWNDGDSSVADEVLAANYAEEENPWHATARSVFPDLTFTVDLLLNDGNRVVSAIRWQGTHNGEFNGIPPTGKLVKGHGIWIHQVENGKILKEHWEASDSLGLGQQLSLILKGTATGMSDNSWGH